MASSSAMAALSRPVATMRRARCASASIGGRPAAARTARHPPARLGGIAPQKYAGNSSVRVATCRAASRDTAQQSAGGDTAQQSRGARRAVCAGRSVGPDRRVSRLPRDTASAFTVASPRGGPGRRNGSRAALDEAGARRVPKTQLVAELVKEHRACARGTRGGRQRAKQRAELSSSCGLYTGCCAARPQAARAVHARVTPGWRPRSARGTSQTLRSRGVWRCKEGVARRGLLAPVPSW